MTNYRWECWGLTYGGTKNRNILYHNTQHLEQRSLKMSTSSNATDDG